MGMVMTEEDIEALFEKWVKEKLEVDVSVCSLPYSNTRSVRVSLSLDGVEFSTWSDEFYVED